jgi:polysaccharide biosynthesis transport protein
VLLFGLAAWAMISAAAGPAGADDGAKPEKPKATVYLQLKLNEKMLASATGQNIQTEFEYFKKTQKQFVKHPLVLLAALRKPEIAAISLVKDQKDPVEWLRKNLQIEFPDDAEIMQISLAGANPKECAILVEAVVNAYYSEFVEAERKRRDERFSDLRRIYNDKSQEMKESLNELRKTADMLGTADSETLNIGQQNLLEELQLARREFIRSQFELNRMKCELVSQQALLQESESLPISDLECYQSASSDPILKKLGEEVVTREIVAEDKDQTNLERLKNQYSQRLEQIRREIAVKKKSDVSQEIKKLEAAISLAAKQQAAAEEDLTRLRKAADRFGTSSIEMQMRRADIRNRQKALDNLAAELETLGIEARDPPRVLRMMGEAEVSD